MIPTVDDLRSDPMTHRFGDLFAPPGLTNFLGCVQADVDIMAIRSLNFPPFGCGDVITGTLFINGRLFQAIGAAVTHTWFPDRIVREAEADGVRIRTTTILPVGAMAALVLLEITNLRGDRDLDVALDIRSGITKKTDAWNLPETPFESEHDVTIEPGTKMITHHARGSGARGVQAALPAPHDASPTEMRWRVPVRTGQTWELRYVHVLGDGDLAAQAQRLLGDAHAQIQGARDEWNAELRALFTPGNGRYSGSLPELETDDEDIRRIYWMGAVGTAYFKRESPYSVVGRTYDTLMPRYWPTVTFLWDYSLTSPIHALLDPDVMRRNLELWMRTDMHTCFGTDWLTGGPVGVWYSVNDYAMTKMSADYLRFSGDRAWLNEEVGGVRVLDRLETYATNWERFRTPNGLADYGGIGNLLECVSTYIHEVAAMNAGNVFNLRTVADLLDANAHADRAAPLRAQAGMIADEIKKLYVDGGGFFNARFPDGSLVPVRHCYDFITVLATMPTDLTDAQQQEMATFCLNELRTPTWMHALSPYDGDTMFSVRPDHQWTGAYPAWPPEAVRGLYAVGRTDDALTWLKGLARSANQGPFAQAHFADIVVEPEHGGARKAPPDFPWITDWACSSNGSWSAVVIESIFGVKAAVDGTLTARPAFGAFDPNARLRNLRVNGRLYDVDRDGLHAVND